MNEEVLLRLGFDATAVKRGTMAMMDQQKKAAMDYVSFWKKAISDREQAEIQADVRAASRANKARALVRQRHDERVGRFRQELASMRTVKAEAKNLRGVALENLQRNVAGARGGLHGGFGANSTAMREMVTIARETSRGNWSRIPGSLSILLQSFGKLGTVIGALVNPVTIAVAAIGAAVTTLYRVGQNAIMTQRNAAEAGISTDAYQTFIRQANRESGGGQAATEALGTFGQNLAGLRKGDMGELQKFRRYGIATTGQGGNPLSNQQILSNVLQRYETINDPAKRAAMAMDIFGGSYKKFVKTLEEGSEGFQKAMGKGVQSAGQLAVWSVVGEQLGNVWSGIKRAPGEIWNAIKSTTVFGATHLAPGSFGKLQKETDRSLALDAEEQRLIAAGKIKPRHMSQAEFEKTNPEMAANLKNATMAAEDVQAELADRGKMGLSELAEQGRRLSGHIRPRQYTVTARMRTAMKIDDLEAAATRAWERGDDKLMGKLRGEADAMRKASPWLKFQDQNPTRKITEQLVQANKYLADVQAMAKFVMSEK